MQILLNILIGFVVALVVKFVLEYLAVPSPFPMLVAAIVFLGFVFADHFGVTYPWRR